MNPNKNSHPRKYKHLFFDLDRTLWDFETNNLESFTELYTHFDLQRKGIVDFDAFFKEYHVINYALWDEYKQQLITKEHLNFNRFYRTLKLFGIEDELLATDMGKMYLHISPQKKVLYPQTHELLDALSVHYTLHIITNGFEDVQYVKISNSGLDKYFKTIITSEKAGYKKPAREIFEYALAQTGAFPVDSLIIGDDPEADIWGAHQAGWDQIWVKHLPLKPEMVKPTYSVDRVEEILTILI